MLPVLFFVKYHLKFDISTKDKITATHELDDNSDSNEAKFAVVPSTGDDKIV